MSWFSNYLPKQEDLQQLEVYPPYHCPNCLFIWDSQKLFGEHKYLCLSDPESLKTTALSLNIPYYSAEKSNQIPPGRCVSKVKTGTRKGQICLREAMKSTLKCSLHTKPNPSNQDAINEQFRRFGINQIDTST